MNNFDSFFGSGNFDGSENKEVIIQEKEVVCRSEEIEIVQQKLIVIQEVAKRLVSHDWLKYVTNLIFIASSRNRYVRLRFKQLFWNNSVLVSVLS